MPPKAARLLALTAALCLTSTARAGFDEALTSFRIKYYAGAYGEAKKAADGGDGRAFLLLGMMYSGGLGVARDPKQALEWFEKAEKAGILGAHAKLALAYLRGEGVPKDMEKGLAHARQGARAGDPEARFMVFLALTTGPLSQFDAAGKTDRARYEKLAARPLSERMMDTEARDALYSAAAAGTPMAQVTLGLALGGTVGEGNRERLLQIAGKPPANTHPALQAYEKIARRMQGLGRSLASPQLFLDAQVPMAAAGQLRTCGLQEGADKETLPPPQLVALSPATPLSGAVWLPSKVKGFEHAYLISGTWEEDWTWKACERTAAVRVKFTADGLGGARFETTLPGKDTAARKE